jgi:hypothetical protein
LPAVTEFAQRRTQRISAEHNDMERAMADETSRPDDIDQPVAVPVAPVRTRWWNRRTPLLLTGAALLLGCVLGAGVAAVGALVIGGDHHGDGRGFSNRDERGDGPRGFRGRDDAHRPGGDDRRDRPAPAPSVSAPGTIAPSASVVPTPTRS